MGYKVFIEPEEQVSQKLDSLNLNDGHLRMLNLNIKVKDNESLDEYKGSVEFQSGHLEKLNRWITKNKYTCAQMNNANELELKVEIFKFNLKKVPKSNIEQLKLEIC